MKGNVIETLMGALVLLIAMGCVFFAYRSAGTKISNSNYLVIAKFEQIDGIAEGTDVKLGGIKIGVVTNQFLDPNSYQAVISMAIDNNIKLPDDSTAQIVSEGLLGGKYVSIIPGSDEKMLANNDQIKYTQSSINLETLIGKFIFSSADATKKAGKPAVPTN